MTWPAARLVDLCEINVGRTPARANREYWGMGHPWLSIADMSQGRLLTTTSEQITDVAVRETGGTRVEPGTVVLSFKLSIGKVGIAGIPMFTNEAIAALPVRDESRLDPYYLAWALDALDLAGGANRAAMGATLNKGKLASVAIPLPSLGEQRRIVDILDRADALRIKRYGALRRLNVLLQSVFLEMFGDPLDRPARWPMTVLSEAVMEGTIVTYGIVQAGKEVPSGVPYIRTGDIVDGEIAVQQLRRTTPEIASRFSRSEVRAGDIVMSIRATVGTTAIVPPELDGANLTQGTARIAPSKDVQGPYLVNMLRAPSVQHWLQRQVKGATFREITLSRLRELPVSVPPRKLQQAFARRSAHIETLRLMESASLGWLDDLFNSLQQRAFNGML